MPRYVYIAKPEPNKTIHGNIDAESEQDAINKLTKMGFFPISVEEETLALDAKSFLRFKKFNSKEIVLFTSQLSSLVDSGLNIINAINIIQNQTPNKYLKSVLNDVVDRIKDGQSLSNSLAAYPQLFSSLYSAIISTGEASGNLNNVLKRLSNFLEKEEEFRSALRQSLVYPFFVFIVGALTVATLLIFVIPRLVGMFEDMGQVLPLPTRILINTSDFLRNYWWLIFTITGLLIFLLRRSGRLEHNKIFFDKFKLNFWIWGEIILKTEISRFTRTLSLLLSSGIPITSALNICISTLDNRILKLEVQNFGNQINSGSSLSSCLKNSKFFPDLVTNIVATGEETGSLEKSLARIADTYETDVDKTLKALSRMLEPVIILFVGLIVGFIVLSMLLPIFQINLMIR